MATEYTTQLNEPSRAWPDHPRWWELVARDTLTGETITTFPFGSPEEALKWADALEHLKEGNHG